MIETARLRLRRMSTADAPFMVTLLNDPSFLRHIGDKGVRTREDAVRYLETGPLDSYARFGFGLYLVESKDTGEPMGMCGLLKRDVLEHPDLGFAFLPAFFRRGFGLEAARAALDEARERFALQRVLAVTSQDNVASIGLLGRLGFVEEGAARLAPGAPPLRLFAWSGA